MMKEEEEGKMKNEEEGQHYYVDKNGKQLHEEHKMLIETEHELD